MKKKVLWLSRHELTAEQKSDLGRKLGVEELEFCTENITFEATEDWEADMTENLLRLGALREATDADIIAGVFPPVVMEALTEQCPPWKVYSPVSAQSAAERADGSKQITFRHVRWARVW